MAKPFFFPHYSPHRHLPLRILILLPRSSSPNPYRTYSIFKLCSTSTIPTATLNREGFVFFSSAQFIAEPNRTRKGVPQSCQRWLKIRVRSTSSRHIPRFTTANLFSQLSIAFNFPRALFPTTKYLGEFFFSVS